MHHSSAAPDIPIIALFKPCGKSRTRHASIATSTSSNLSSSSPTLAPLLSADASTGQKLSRRRKRDLWNKIDAEFLQPYISNECGELSLSHLASVCATPPACTQMQPQPQPQPQPHNRIECVYRSNGMREYCDACNSTVSVTDEGFMACSNPMCSIIYKDVLDHSAEWRYYGADNNQLNDPTRCGMPVNPLLVESSYGCKVLCDGPSSYEMRKIRRYSEWQAMPYREKAQYDEFQRITIVAHNNEIPKIIIDEALRHHKRISEHKTFRGLNRDGVIAASVYVACRIHNCPRTAKEIATIFSLDITSATRGCKNALVIINELECDMVNSDKTSFCKTTPNAFIDRYCSRLNMNAELTQVCMFIAARIDKRQLIPENTPHSIAAGIVYFIAQTCGLNISKRDVNRVSEISEVTINKCFKKLDAHLGDLVPKSIIAKYTKSN
jgi:transcription initiation factor TFIIB